MVMRVTENGMRGQPDTIDRECILEPDCGGFLVMYPGECHCIEDANGAIITVSPSLVADLEAWL